MFHKPENVFALTIILPLGISFHTFQSMSYVIDVYRKEQEPITNPIDYALFISFFPQLVAGPIVRAREFFGDLYHWKRPTSEDVLRGLLLLFLGLVKKMVMADQFAQIANGYFQDVTKQPGMASAWSAAIAFGIQIYFDFSGYTDMAIGMAKLLGFHFPVNFRRPYLASSITDFWHRWHISLSRWLRDYLYIPLGGNRHGRLQTYRNLMLTMLLGGLWHGASWNFVVWGGYHGALLSFERMFRGKRSAEPARWTLFYPLQAVITFGLVMIGWVFFRATTFHDSLYVLHQMFFVPHGRQLIPALGSRCLALIHPAAGAAGGEEGVVRGNLARSSLGLWSGVRAAAALGGTDRIHRDRRAVRLLPVLAAARIGLWRAFTCKISDAGRRRPMARPSNRRCSAQGLAAAPNSSEAQLVVLNTCTVTASG